MRIINDHAVCVDSGDHSADRPVPVGRPQPPGVGVARLVVKVAEPDRVGRQGADAVRVIGKILLRLVHTQQEDLFLKRGALVRIRRVRMGIRLHPGLHDHGLLLRRKVVEEGAVQKAVDGAVLPVDGVIRQLVDELFS